MDWIYDLLNVNFWLGFIVIILVWYRVFWVLIILVEFIGEKSFGLVILFIGWVYLYGVYCSLFFGVDIGFLLRLVFVFGRVVLMLGEFRILFEDGCGWWWLWLCVFIGLWLWELSGLWLWLWELSELWLWLWELMGEWLCLWEFSVGGDIVWGFCDLWLCVWLCVFIGFVCLFLFWLIILFWVGLEWLFLFLLMLLKLYIFMRSFIINFK